MAVHWRFILHGKQAGNEALRAEVARLRAEGGEVGVRVTWEAGDGARFANEAVADGVGMLLAGGGDGTLNEIAGALAARSEPADRLPALAVLPLGTANDFATAAQVPPILEEAIAHAQSAPLRPVDLVRVDCDGRAAWFVNVATGGFGTEVTTETPEELKRSFGRVAYLMTGIARFGSLRSAHGLFRGNGFSWQGEFLTLLGPSGCGKTTLLNLIAGLDRPTIGDVEVHGRTALMFQEAALFPWLNVRDNVALPMRLAGKGKIKLEPSGTEMKPALRGRDGLLTSMM